MAGGRQRSFDKQTALEQAMRVFWQKGYAGSSLMDLTNSMGINKPSMYSAFGNKEQLFILAMENYMDKYANKHSKYLAEKNVNAFERLRNYLLSILASQSGQDGPIGCFLSVCISESISEEMPKEAVALIEKVKHLGESQLQEFFVQTQENQELITQSSPKQLAQFFVSMIHGTAAMARAGKTEQQLIETLDTALLLIQSSSK